MTVVQPTHEPAAAAALAALFDTEDAMPAARQPVAMFLREGTLVVLLGSTEAWAAWVIALQERHEGPVPAQAGIHVATAEGCVCGCPVMLVSGDYTPGAAATDEPLETVNSLAERLKVPHRVVAQQVSDLCKAYGPRVIVAEARGMGTTVLTVFGSKSIKATIAGMAVAS